MPPPCESALPADVLFAISTLVSVVVRAGLLLCSRPPPVVFVTPPAVTINVLPVIDVFVMLTSWLLFPCTSMPPPKPTP